MKKKNIVIIATIAMAVVGALTVGSIQSQASATVEQEAQQVMSHYLDAVVANNAEEVVKYVVDSRYKDTAEAVIGYKETMRSNPVSSYRIVSVTPQGSSKAVVKVEFTSQNSDTPRQVDLYVEKKGQEWKVMLEQVPMVKA